MYLAYFDESGDSGPVARSPTKFFVLPCVLVEDGTWLSVLDRLVRVRRRMRTLWKFPTTPEIKASDFRKSRGVFVGSRLSAADRGEIFCKLLGYQDRLGLTSFAVAVNKRSLHAGRDPRDVAWQYALQRVDTFCRKRGQFAALFPDAGHGYFIRRMVRRLRRHQIIAGHFGGLLNIRGERIVEDPSDRHSHDSYFIQVADWTAYAAHRSPYVDPAPPPFNSAWDAIGGARLLAVNRLRTGPPGIVLYP